MNQRQRNNNIFAGVVLIFLAFYIVAKKMVELPDIHLVKIVFTCLFVYLIYKGIRRKDWGLIFIPGSLIICQYRDLISISSSSSFTIVLAAVLLTIGFNLIFNKKNFKHNDMEVIYDTDGQFVNEDGLFTDYTVKDKKDGKKIVIDNGLGSATRYIQEQDVKEIIVDNGMGQCTVYFQNCSLADNVLKMKVDNGMGATTIYFPGEWGLNLKQDNGLGKVKVIGTPCTDVYAPCVDIFVDNGMGIVNLIFG